MITAEHLHKSYKEHPALSDISLTIQDGDLYGIAGLNGAGKSTLLSILSGLIPPDKGTVCYDGTDIFSKKVPPHLRIGFVPQELALFQDLLVIENLEFWAWSGSPKTKTDAQNNARNAAIQSGLEHTLKKKVSSLSGGMKRRVNIASALAMNPDVLIMDEPTVGLDIKNRRDIMRFIRSLARSPLTAEKNSDGVRDGSGARGMTVLITSHQSGELETFCDRLLLLHQGKKIYEGCVGDIFRTAPFIQCRASGMSAAEHSGDFPKLESVDDILYHLDHFL